MDHAAIPIEILTAIANEAGFEVSHTAQPGKAYIEVHGAAMNLMSWVLVICLHDQRRIYVDFERLDLSGPDAIEKIAELIKKEHKKWDELRGAHGVSQL